MFKIFDYELFFEQQDISQKGKSLYIFFVTKIADFY